MVWEGFPCANSLCPPTPCRNLWFLVAPYCAIPRDYLSDTPLLRAMGFLVSQHGQLGAIPPLPFLSVSPLEYMRSGGAIPPPQKGYLSDSSAIPYENKANGCDTPLCDTISKGYCAIWGGISHWAAKLWLQALCSCKIGFLRVHTFAGKKKAYTDLLQWGTFLLPKKWGPQRKDFSGRYGSSWFLYGFRIYHWPGKFFFKASKSSPIDFLSVVVVYAFFSVFQDGPYLFKGMPLNTHEWPFKLKEWAFGALKTQSLRGWESTWDL